VAIAIRDKIFENSRQFVAPGEQVQAVLGGQTLNNWLLIALIVGVMTPLFVVVNLFVNLGVILSGLVGGSLAGLVVSFWNDFRAVLVTDRRILVLACGKWGMGTPRSIVRELPRNIRIGPASGLWWKSESLGEKLYIHNRFHKDVAAADAAIGL